MDQEILSMVEPLNLLLDKAYGVKVKLENSRINIFNYNVILQAYSDLPMISFDANEITPRELLTSIVNEVEYAFSSASQIKKGMQARNY